MSFLGLSGLFGGDNGADWKAQQAQLDPAVSNAQAQQALAASAAPQNGQTQQALAQQQAFINALGGQNGIGNQSQVYAQQQALANQLGAMANGQGPSPAQAMLAQQTGNNIASQSALMAGQRGAGANAGLIARQAGMQGANTQQQAVGQAATMQAQQQLAAIGALQAQQANLANLATTQVGQQAQANQFYNQAVQGAQSLQQQQAQANQNALLGAVSGQNQLNLGNISQQNAANVNIAKGNQAFQTGLVAGAMKGAGSGLAGGGGAPPAAPVAPAAKGGRVTPGEVIPPEGRNPVFMDLGGGVPIMSPQIMGGVDANPFDSNTSGAKGKGFDPNATPQDGGDAMGNAMGGAMKKAITGLFASPAMAHGGEVSEHPRSFIGKHIKGMNPMAMAHGGSVPAMLSPGEIYLSPEQAQMVAGGKGDPMKMGKKIPGQAKVKGDSLKNDIIPATLQEGGIVLPRHVTMASDREEKARKFVEAVMAKKKGKAA